MMAPRRGARQPSKSPPHLAALGPPERTLGPLARFVLAAAIPIVLLSARLRADLWGDEVYTLTQFVTRDWSRLLAPPWEPNHHMLYTVVLKSAVELADVIVVWRFPGWVFAVLTLATLYRLGGRFGPPGTGELAVLTLGTNQMFLDQALQLRGYGLSALLTSLLCAACWSPTVSHWKSAGVALLVAALVLTVPTNLVFVAALAVLRGARLARTHVGREMPATESTPRRETAGQANRGTRIESSVPAERGTRTAVTRRGLFAEAGGWLGGLALAAAVYWPLAGDVRRAAEAARPPEWSWPLRLAGDVLWAAERDFVPLWIMAAVALGATWRSSRRAHPHPAWRGSLAGAGIAFVGLSFFFTLGLARPPFVRNYGPLLPGLAVVLAIGWRQCAAQFAARWSDRWPGLASTDAITTLAGITLLAAVAPWLATYPARLDCVRRERFAQDGYYNFYATRYEPARLIDELIARLPEHSPYLVACDAADYHVVHFYLGRAGVPAARVLDPRATSAPVTLYWVAPPRPLYEDAAARYAVATETLAGLPRVTEFGYYALHASAEPVMVRLVPPSARGQGTPSSPDAER